MGIEAVKSSTFIPCRIKIKRGIESNYEQR